MDPLLLSTLERLDERMTRIEQKVDDLNAFKMKVIGITFAIFFIFELAIKLVFSRS